MPFWLPISLVLGYIPYQLLLSVSAIRAVYRHLRQQNNWEKTQHVGAHRGVGVREPVLDRSLAVPGTS